MPSKEKKGNKKNAKTKRSLRVVLGRFLDRTGQLCLPLGVGLFGGYWIADLGVPWTTGMLGGLAVFVVFALLLILAGQAFKGKLVRMEEGSEVPRKRTIVLLTLALLAAVVRLGAFWLEQPAPLTRLPRADLRRSFELDTQQYRALDRELERLVQRIESSDLAARPGEGRRPLSATDEALLRDVWVAFYNDAFALDQIRIFYEDWYRFDPSRAERPLLLRSYLLTYAAELALFEKSLRLTRQLAPREEVTKFLDAPHLDAGLPEHTFSVFRQEFLGARDEARVVAGKRYLQGLDRTFAVRETAADLGFGGLWTDVERHLQTVGEAGLLERAEHSVRADLQVLKRGVRRTWFPAQKGVANWVAGIKTRRVGRYLITREQQDLADAAFEPGDILLSRKNWHLSNVGLPGFWPHAILYIGRPEELEAAFDVPEVRAWLRELTGDDVSLGEHLIRTYPGQWSRYLAGLEGDPIVVLEAVGEGVHLTTMPHAAGDYLAGLRPRLSPLAKAQAIVEAWSHLGKPYDFDFDFATDHVLVCTEVIWRSYRPQPGKEGLDLPVQEVAGRLTLPANEIARLYTDELLSEERQLDFVYFIDAREHEEIAIVADDRAFQTTHLRSKWDIFQR